jgi:ferredoxin
MHSRALPTTRTTTTPTTRRPHSIFVARRRLSTTTVAASANKPACTVAVTFVQQQVGGADAASPPIVVEIESDSQLRAAMIANKVDLYTTWGKIWSCGGAGQCGTCIVDVKQASDDCLTERSAAEEKKLKGKPATWRLACQTYVGDGQTPGQTVTIATKPQQ